MFHKYRFAESVTKVKALISFTHFKIFHDASDEVFDEIVSTHPHIHGLVQDCSNSIANALEVLQSCTTLSILGGKYA